MNLSSNNHCITPTELLLIAHSYNQVTTEHAALLLLPTLSKRQHARMRALNSAIDRFECYLGDLGAVASGSAISSALSAGLAA